MESAGRCSVSAGTCPKGCCYWKEAEKQQICHVFQHRWWQIHPLGYCICPEEWGSVPTLPERVPKGTQGLSWDPFGTYCLPPACQPPPRTCPEASPWSCVQGHQRHNPRQRCLNTTQGPVKVVGEEENNSRVNGKPPSLGADGSYPALILPQPSRGRPCPRGLVR